MLGLVALAEATIHGISYVSGPFLSAKPRLEATMPIYFDKFKVYTFEDLDHNFIEDHDHIFKHKRGGGYWIWKFHIVQKHLNLIDDDDILVYLDGGCILSNTTSAKNILMSMSILLRKMRGGFWAQRFT